MCKSPSLLVDEDLVYFEQFFAQESKKSNIKSNDDFNFERVRKSIENRLDRKRSIKISDLDLSKFKF